MNRKLTVRLTAGAFVVAVLSGCGSDPEEDVELTEPERAELAAAIEYGNEQTKVLDDIIGRLTRECMEDKGFDNHHGFGFDEGTPVAVMQDDPEVKYEAKLMYLDQEFISESGYGLALWETHPWSVDPELEKEESLTGVEADEYYEAEYGAVDTQVDIIYPDGNGERTFPVKR